MSNLRYYWIAFICISSSVMGAELDALNLRLLDQYDSGLRWNNVERSPDWVTGVAPNYSRGCQLHLVTLQPGQSVTCRVPRLAMMRIYSPKKTLHSSDLDIWLTNGSGLFIKHPSASTKTDGSLLIVPDRSEPMLAKIERPATCSGTIQFAVFNSHLNLLNSIAPYRHPLHVSKPDVRLCTDKAEDQIEFLRVAPNRPRVFLIEGPTRIAVETRLIYTAGESRLFHTYRVRVELNGKPYQELEYLTGGEHRRPIVGDGTPYNVGRLETAFVNIPEGRHRVGLTASSDVFLRFTEQRLPDFLKRHFNMTCIEPVATETDSRDRISLWDVSPNDIQSCIQQGAPISLLEKVSLYSARNNQHRDGGAQGWMLMRQAAARRIDAPSLRGVADKIRGFHTFYRDLVPTDADADADAEAAAGHRFAWFHSRTLNHLDETDRRIVIADQHLNDALRQLSHGDFVAVHDHQPLVYRLPSDCGDSQLRIATCGDEANAANRFYVQFDNGPPMVMDHGSPSPVSDFRLSVPEAALTGLWHQHQKYGHGTLGGPFAATRVPEKLLNAAHGEILLPAHVKQVRVWKDKNGSNSTLWLALQYRASKPHELSETTYLSYMRRAKFPRLEIVARLFSPESSPESSSENLSEVNSGERYPDVAQEAIANSEPVANYEWHEIKNHWQPLLRLLWSHRADYRAAVTATWPLSSVTTEDLPQPKQTSRSNLVVFDDLPRAESPIDDTRSDEIVTDPVAIRARSMMAQEAWLPAIELYTKVLERASGELRRDALFGRNEALQGSGNSFLAERQLRAIFLFDRDSTARQMASERLVDYYIEQNQIGSLEQFLACRVLKNPSDQNLLDLAEVFLENGRHDFALLLALISNPETGVVQTSQSDVALRSSAKVGWWQVFDDQLTKLKDPQARSYWEGIRCLRHGSYQTALQHFSNAGERGAGYARHLTWSFEIQRQLKSSNGDFESAMASWCEWIAQHPGDHFWQEDRSIVDRFCGGESVYSVARDLHAQFFKATPTKPLRLRVVGPVTLKLQIRPIHTAKTSDPIDDWVQIKSTDGIESIPIFNNYANSQLKIVGDPTRVPGRKLENEMKLAAGIHLIEINADQHDLLVRSFVRRPEQLISVLAPPTESLMNAIFEGRFTQVERLGETKSIVLQTQNPQAKPQILLPIRQQQSSYQLNLERTIQPFAAPQLRSDEPLEVLPTRILPTEIEYSRPARDPSPSRTDANDHMVRRGRPNYRGLRDELRRSDSGVRPASAIVPIDRQRSSRQLPLTKVRQNSKPRRAVAVGAKGLTFQERVAAKQSNSEIGTKRPRPRLSRLPNPNPEPIRQHVDENQNTESISKKRDSQFRISSSDEMRPRAKSMIRLASATEAIEPDSTYEIVDDLETVHGIGPNDDGSNVFATSVTDRESSTVAPLKAPDPADVLFVEPENNHDDQDPDKQLPEPDASTEVAHGELVYLSLNDAIRRMRELLRLAETDADARIKIQNEAARLLDEFPRDATLQSLHERIQRGMTWRLFSQFESGAGVRAITVLNFAPESPDLRARKALLDEVDDHAQVLVGADKLVIDVEASRGSSLEFSLRIQDIPFLPAVPVTVMIEVDGADRRYLTLNPRQPDRKIALRIDPKYADVSLRPDPPNTSDSKRVSLWVEPAFANQYLRARIQQRFEDGSTADSDVFEKPTRMYQVATQQEPVQISFVGPGRLRIDELRDDATYTSYLEIGDGRKKIELRPIDDRPEALFRVFEWTPANQKIEDVRTVPSMATATSVLPPVIPHIPSVNVLAAAIDDRDMSSLALTTPELTSKTFFADDLYELGGQEDATWSLEPSWVSRRTLEEGLTGTDGVTAREPDEFVQFDLTRRRVDDWFANDHRSSVLYRERDNAGSTFGLKHRTWFDSIRWCNESVSGSLEGSAYAQEPGLAVSLAESRIEWAGFVRGQLEYEKRWSPTFRQSVSLSAFGRWLSLDENPYAAGRIDQDVFTKYKSQHRSGFTLSTTSSYRPWRDTRWWCRAFASSNENFDPFALDMIGIRTGWDQAVGPIEFGLSYRLAKFLDDQDRETDFLQHLLYADAVADYWHSPRRRFELGTNVQHDLARGDTSVFLFLTWYFDNGRDYEDFITGEKVFRQLRRLRAAQRLNNRIIPIEG